MTETGQPPKSEARWQRLWRRPRSRWLLGIPVGAFLFFGIGIVTGVQTTRHKDPS